MRNFKFKKGDKVRIAKIENDYYGLATYEIGDVGTIIKARNNPKYGKVYQIQFSQSYTGWWAKEDWLKPEKALIVCE